jgi:hypothetical protein
MHEEVGPGGPTYSREADEGVGRGPGGPPYFGGSSANLPHTVAASDA